MKSILSDCTVAIIGVATAVAVGTAFVGSVLADSDEYGERHKYGESDGYGERYQHSEGRQYATDYASNEWREYFANQGADRSATGLTIDQIVAIVKKQGYAGIYEVERESANYEVKARDAQGHRVELYVDAGTGQLLRRKYDD